VGVRRESVELSLSDVDFTTGMARAAAQTALLNRELGNLDGTSARADRSTRALAADDGGIARTGDKARKSSNDLNEYTGRLNALVSAAVTLGPALIPLTAGAIPAVTGLAAGFGAAAGAVGVAMLAFHGVGDALKAFDAYSLQPTTANLGKLNEKLAGLGPGGAELVKTLHDLEPALQQLQGAARGGLLPGGAEGLRELLPLLPQVERIIGSISTEMGTLAEKAGHGLVNDAEFKAFFHYLETDAAPTLDAFAKAAGNVGAGLAQMTVDFAPVNRDFASGLVHASEEFRQWSDGLAQSQGFHEFMAYIEQEGPKAVALLESLGNAALGIVQAAQPVGQVVMPALTALLNVLGAIGKSPLGPVIYTGVAGAIAFSKASGAMSSMLAKLTAQTAALSAEMKGLAASEEAAAVAGAGVGKGRAALNGVYAGLGTRGARSASGLIGAAIGAPFVADGLNNLFGNNVDYSRPGVNAGDLGKTAYYSDHAYSWKNPLGSILTGVTQAGGGILGVNTPLDAMRNSTAGADLTLAQMQQNGQGAQAAHDFDLITAAAKKQGESIADLRKQYPNYTAALNQAKTANGGLSATQAANAQAALQQAAALKQATDAALGAFDAETNYRQALKDAAAQAAKSNAGINGSTDAALANRSALSKLAAAWNGQSDAVKGNTKRYAEAKQSFIDMATGMGVPIGQAKRLANQLLEVPKSVQSKIQVDTALALAGIDTVKNALANMHGKTLDVYINRIDTSGVGNAAANAQHQGHAAGGYTGRGGKYEPAGTVHRDEVVLPSEVVHRDAAFLRARYGYLPGMSELPGYADGGFVGHGLTIVPLLSPYAAAKDNGVTIDKDGHLQKQLKQFSNALQAATNSLSKETQARDSLVSTISGNLTSGNLFGTGTGVTGSVFGQQFAPGSISAVNATLAQQIKDANDTTDLEKSLHSRGLSGDALQALIEQGGVSELRTFSAASNSDLATYQSLYGQRATAVGKAADTGALVLGMTQAQAKTTTQVAVLTGVVQQIQREINVQRKQAAAAAKEKAKAAREAAKAQTQVAHRARRHR
jgi:hypothetical protein